MEVCMLRIVLIVLTHLTGLIAAIGLTDLEAIVVIVPIRQEVTVPILLAAIRQEMVHLGEINIM